MDNSLIKLSVNLATPARKFSFFFFYSVLHKNIQEKGMKKSNERKKKKNLLEENEKIGLELKLKIMIVRQITWLAWVFFTVDLKLGFFGVCGVKKFFLYIFFFCYQFGLEIKKKINYFFGELIHFLTLR